MCSLWPMEKIKNGLSQIQQNSEISTSLKDEEIQVEARRKLGYEWTFWGRNISLPLGITVCRGYLCIPPSILHICPACHGEDSSMAFDHKPCK